MESTRGKKSFYCNIIENLISLPKNNIENNKRENNDELCKKIYVRRKLIGLPKSMSLKNKWRKICLVYSFNLNIFNAVQRILIPLYLSSTSEEQFSEICSLRPEGRSTIVSRTIIFKAPQGINGA